MPKQKSTARAALTGAAAAANGPKTIKVKVKKQTKASFPPHLKVVVDPWNSPTEGAGRPDHNADPSIPWPEHWPTTITTDARGNFLVSFRGILGNAVFQTALDALADPTIGASTNIPMPNIGVLQTTFTDYRPLVIAVEAEYIGEEQLAKGVLGIVKTSSNPTSGEFLSSLTDEPYYKETSIREKVAARLPFPENDFQAIAGTSSSGAINIIGMGLPASSPCVRLRFTAVYEMKVSHTALLSRDTSHTIAHPGQVATVASIVGPRAITAVGKDPVQTLINHGEKMVLVAGAINGVFQAAKPVLALMADFAALL